MSVTSLHMHNHNHGLDDVSLVISAHTLGMFGLSVVNGALIDRLGRRRAIAVGAVILIAGSLLAPTSLMTQWLALARVWRAVQLKEIESQLARVAEAAGLGADAPVIGAGCGAVLAAEVAACTDRPFLRFAHCVLPSGARQDDVLLRWADVCAPAVAVALLQED